MIDAWRKRFWHTAGVRAAPGGFAIYLDERPLHTPAKRELVVPTASLAAAVAEEWNRSGPEVQPDEMHFTRAANSAIDRIAGDPGSVIDALAAYGETDLLCYRAVEPAALRQRQAALWDPWLDWSQRALAAPLIAVSGVMHYPQPKASLSALRAAVAGHGPFALAGLHDLVTLSGSLVLGLAVARNELDPDAAWRISRLDEDWQAEQWGVDAEAEAAAALRHEAFRRAALIVRMTEEGTPTRTQQRR